MSVSTFNFCWTRLKQKHFEVFFSFNLQLSLSTFWTQRQKLQTDTDMHVHYLICLSLCLWIWMFVILCLWVSLCFTCGVSFCICLLWCVMKMWIIFSCALDRVYVFSLLSRQIWLVYIMAEKENKNPGDDSVRPKVMAKWKKPAVELTDEQKIDFISAW